MSKIHRGDLFESPFFLTIAENGIKLYFSSERSKTRFSERIVEEIERGDERLNNVYKNVFDIECSILSILRLYYKEERGGFAVEYQDIQYEQPWDIPLSMVIEKEV